MARAQRVRHIPADAHENDLLGEMGSFEADRHRFSPSLIRLDCRGRSYLTPPQMRIATKPTLLPPLICGKLTRGERDTRPGKMTGEHASGSVGRDHPQALSSFVAHHYHAVS